MAFDCIVIGGGPAGMIAAITAARAGKNVVLLEKNDRLGKKLLITGKGRCNVTNDCTADEVLKNTPRNGKFLFSAMATFPPEKATQFFEDAGCALKTARGNRVFPTTDRSQTVLEALQRELKNSGVIVKTARVLSLEQDESGVTGVATSSGFFEARKIILPPAAPATRQPAPPATAISSPRLWATPLWNPRAALSPWRQPDPTPPRCRAWP